MKKRQEKIVAIDFETTGQEREDEVLQVSIIDGEYNVLLNTYCRPRNKKNWEDAQGIHGITPEMVANELSFEEYVPMVADILQRSDLVIAYNVAFENGFLRSYGIEIEREKWFDPMLKFAEIYGEWNDYYCDYKWQSLEECAAYYGYEFKAHDSLEDVRATMYCYKKMMYQQYMWEQELLFDVIERYIFHSEKSRSDNPVVRETAQKMCEVELWEMWALAQYRTKLC